MGGNTSPPPRFTHVIMNKPVRNFVFTLNNPDGPITWWEDVRYAIYQRERGANGTEHFQGYVELSKAVRFNAIKAKIPRAHIEQRRGSRDQAREYCKKLDSRVSEPIEYGNWEAGGSGARNDLASAIDLIKSGGTFRDLAEQSPEVFVKYYRGLQQLRYTTQPERSWSCALYIIIGPPGCGKSKLCRASFPNAYWKPPTCKWWDGYDGHSDVIIDDFYGGLQWSVLLNVCDRYPCAVETKGGMVNMLARRVAITSNACYKTWYAYGEQMKLYALERRITLLITDCTPDREKIDLGLEVVESVDIPVDAPNQ